MKETDPLIRRITQFRKHYRHKDKSPLINDLLLSIANYTNEKTGMPCFASDQELANISGVTRQSIINARKKMVKMGLIIIEHRFKKNNDGKLKRKKTSNYITINEKLINHVLIKNGVIRESKNFLQPLSKKDLQSSQNILHNNTIENTKYNHEDPYKIKNLSKDLTPKEFKSFSKYEKKRLMNDELINAKVHNWLMRGEITDFDVN